MLKFIYLLVGLAITPFAMEWVNTRPVGRGTKLENIVKGWPAYAISVIVSFTVAIIICILPAGWEVGVWNVFILTTVIYFGNQFFFNSLVKPMMNHRKEP